MSYMQNSLAAIFETAIGIYLLLVILRFCCYTLRLDFRNPILNLIGRATNPPLFILWKFIPAIHGIDLAALLLITALGFVKLFLMLLLQGLPIKFMGVLILGIAHIINITIWIFIIAILIRVILSWVAPHSHHPGAQIADGLSAPLLYPIMRLLPNLGGLDFSPVVALLGLRFAQQLLITPLHNWGANLLF